MTSGSLHSVLGEVRHDAATHGLNLMGVVDAQKFDETQPCGRRAADLGPAECGSILVLASGGSSCWDTIVGGCGEAGGSGERPLEPQQDQHPIDDHGEAVALSIVARLAGLGIRGQVVLPNSKRTLNFVQLGEMGGIGTISPVIHQLIHPEFGPWVSLRAAVLLEGKPFGLPVPDLDVATFQPCDGCDRPCISACPAETYGPDGQADTGKCVTHRVVDAGCIEGCEVRRNCRYGQEHRYGSAEEAYRQQHGLFLMQQYRAGGLGQRIRRFWPFRR